MHPPRCQSEERVMVIAKLARLPVLSPNPSTINTDAKVTRPQPMQNMHTNFNEREWRLRAKQYGEAQGPH